MGQHTRTKSSIVQGISAQQGLGQGLRSQLHEVLHDLHRPPLACTVQHSHPGMVPSQGVTARLQQAAERIHVASFCCTLQGCVASHIHQLWVCACLQQALNHLHKCKGTLGVQRQDHSLQRQRKRPMWASSSCIVWLENLALHTDGHQAAP